MSYTSGKIYDQVTCDKCGDLAMAKHEEAGKVFFRQGWVLRPNAKKYIHLCYQCQPKKMGETTDWARKRFNL